MKWIALKPKNLPIVALQIDRAIQIFTQLVQKADKGNSIHERMEVRQLEEQFKNRIEQLDIYYREHSLDENISIFHMLKLKLEKSLFDRKKNKLSNGIDLKNDLWGNSLQEESSFQGNSMKWLDQPLFAYYENSPKKKDGFGSALKEKEKFEDKTMSIGQKGMGSRVVKGKVDNKDKMQSSKVPSKASQLSKKQTVVPASKQFQRPQPLKSKRPSHLKTEGTSTPAFRDDPLNPVQLLQDMKRSSQLKFTIKMTKQQYRQLLQLKKQQQLK